MDFKSKLIKLINNFNNEKKYTEIDLHLWKLDSDVNLKKFIVNISNDLFYIESNFKMNFAGFF